MTVFVRQTKREIYITLVIWAVLLVAAIIALYLLRQNTTRIIEQIHYVNVNRVAKAEVLYAEAEKHAEVVLEKAEELNLESDKKIVVPATDQHLQKVVALYNEAIELDQTPEFNTNRTIHYERLGQVYEAAGNQMDQLLAHAKAFMAEKNFEDARANILQAEKLNPGYIEPYTLHAQLFELEGQTTQALALLEGAATSGTMTGKAYWVRGRLRQRTGSSQKAVLDLEQAVAKSPQNLTYRMDLGLVLNSIGKKSEAAEVLQAGLEHGAWLDPAYLHIYGDYLAENNDLDEAIRVLSQADELAPHSGDVQWSLARAYHKAGKNRQSAAALRRATEANPQLQERIF